MNGKFQAGGKRAFGADKGGIPVILPVSDGAGCDIAYRPGRLQMAAASLGCPQTQQWQRSLWVAEALSLGKYNTVKLVAAHAGIAADTVQDRVNDLRFIFGVREVPALVDCLLREQFLRFEPKDEGLEIDPGLAMALEDAARDKKLDKEVWEELYAALKCRPTMPAAMRRAYELGLRKPAGLPGARRAGFHMLKNASRPKRYPAAPPLSGTEKDALEITWQAISNKIQSDAGRRLPKEPSGSQLAVASLLALGCTFREAGWRLGIQLNNACTQFGKMAWGDDVAGSRSAKIRRLFESDMFFATQETAPAVRTCS